MDGGSTIGAVILAAGDGSRFGAAKQLADVGGQTLLERSSEPALAHPSIGRCVIVLGAHADQVEAAVGPLLRARAHVRRCPQWQGGPVRSLATGLRALAGCEWALIVLGDELGVPRTAIDRMIALAQHGTTMPSARATWAGRPGHPVLLHRTLWPAIADREPPVPPRDLLGGARTTEVPCEDLGSPFDVDRPADLERASRTLARTHGGLRGDAAMAGRSGRLP